LFDGLEGRAPKRLLHNRKVRGSKKTDQRIKDKERLSTPETTATVRKKNLTPLKTFTIPFNA
jgi:hypothetical protein